MPEAEAMSHTPMRDLQPLGQGCETVYWSAACAHAVYCDIRRFTDRSGSDNKINADFRVCVTFVLIGWLSL